MKFTRHALAILTLVLLPLSAQATPILWTINGMTFDDGGTGSGSFIYDADTNTYSNINITTTVGSVLPGDTYLYPDLLYALSQAPDYFMALDATGADLTGFSFLTTVFSPSALTNAGITTSITGGTEGTCGNPDCSILEVEASFRNVTGGRVTADIVTVPEPETIALFGLGLLGLGLASRRAA